MNYPSNIIIIIQVLNDDDIARVIHCKFSHEIWSHLVVTHERISQVKRAKIDLLCSQYENFARDEIESIDDMITKFTKIKNGLASLSDAIDNDQNVRKVLRAPTIMRSQSYNIERAQ